MVAWDKPKRSNSPPQWPKAVSNYVVIRKTNMTTASVSLSGIINLVQDYLPSNYEFGSIEDMTVYYDDVNDSIVPSSATTSSYDQTRSDSTSGVSSDGQFVDAIINKGVTYDVANTRIPCDDDDDDDDDEGDVTYRHIDLLIRLKPDGVTTTSTAPRRARAPATVTIPDKIEVTVCDLVVQRAARDNGDGEGVEVFVPESSKTFGTVVYSYQEFGTTKSVGNVVYALWQVYDTDTRGNIGQRSPLYLKTNRQGRGKMTRITTSIQLSEELEALLKARKQLVIERDGDDVFCIELSLGLRGATAVAMQQSVIADQLQQATFTQESYDPPANEEDRRGGTRRGRRCASRSLGASALSMFKKYYLDDNNDNPYHHSLSHEHRSVFLTRYENDSSERRQLLEQLNDGEYPSLNWMCNNPLIDASIPPGSKKWTPIDHHGTPPFALPRARPSAWKDDMTGVLNGFVERLEDTPPSPPPQATTVNFFRHDLVNNERYEIPVPPKYISRACEEENGGAGKDLIFQAHYLARNYTRVPLFTANLQQYKDQLNDDTMKIYYRFNDCKYPSNMFLRMSIADILKGNTTNTVQIEMIVEEVGTQLNDEDGVFY